MSAAGTFWRTVRHLKPGQVAARARFRLGRPAPDLRAAPPLRPASGSWLEPARREPSLLGPARLRFLNVTHELDDIGWDSASIAKLWRYNQHYFDDLNALDAQRRRAWQGALMTRWLRDNPPAAGTGWEPFPTSLRIVNWVKFFVGGVQPEAAWLHSLAVQARWLCRRLEWHLLGNHLFANAKALVYAGLFFDGIEAQAWLQRGLAIIDAELDEQVLSDGGHFERSPMYHALALEDLLDLLNLAAARAPAGSAAAVQAARWREVATRMLHWLRCMCHPDGSLALFNDCAAGIAPDLAELEAYAARLGVAAAEAATGIAALAASGYVRVARDAAVAFIDVAPIEPHYLPGHAHADTLSFELSLHGRRVLVNGGTSCYGVDAQRLRERGTAWHNTVQVAGQNSSEVWSGFRVGRRARLTSLQIDESTVAAAHDGYRFLSGAPQHARRWQFDARTLHIDDRVSPATAALARFHVAPGLQLRSHSPNRWLVADGNTELAQISVEAGNAEVVDSLHAPRFGVLLPNQCLQVQLRDGHCATRWTW